MDGLTAGIDLPPNLHAPWAARRLVLTLLSVWELGAPTSDDAAPTDGGLTLTDVAELLINEIVTNAVEHVGGSTPIRVAVRHAGGRLEVCVSDASPALPVVGELDGANPRGRGMAMVDALADRWGCDHMPDGKRVWFELATRTRVYSS